jgi:predicted AAA+ superfamily ATPase
MIARNIRTHLLESLSRFPAVALLGARQVGKTTLAREIAATFSTPSIVLDLERPSDLAKLAEPELYLTGHRDRLMVLDEIQRQPELFPVLRALIDEDRRPGRFLILGSASPALIRQSSESLAGRIAFIELAPFSLAEVGDRPDVWRTLWLRGGFPSSFLAADDAATLQWREAFIQTYLERDIPQFGIRVPAAMLRRFWTMLAHSHGQLWNGAKVAASLGVSGPAVKHYLGILQDTFMVRVLQPCHANLKKRLVKSPKVYLRDSGLLHALLGLADHDSLLSHPVLGASWEGFVIEQILSAKPLSAQAGFYRTSAGAEIDLVLQAGGNRPPVAVEIKYSLSPAPSKGFWSGMADLGCERGFVVAPVQEAYPLGRSVTVLPVGEAQRVWL